MIAPEILPGTPTPRQCVPQTINQQHDAVRHQMNAFVICAGCHLQPLTDLAIRVGKRIGKVFVDPGNNSRDVLCSPDSIRKVRARGTIGKK